MQLKCLSQQMCSDPEEQTAATHLAHERLGSLDLLEKMRGVIIN